MGAEGLWAESDVATVVATSTIHTQLHFIDLLPSSW
jgi:hypothetical protein